MRLFSFSLPYQCFHINAATTDWQDMCGPALYVPMGLSVHSHVHLLLQFHKDPFYLPTWSCRWFFLQHPRPPLPFLDTSDRDVQKIEEYLYQQMFKISDYADSPLSRTEPWAFSREAPLTGD